MPNANDIGSSFTEGFSGGPGDWRSWAHGISHISPMYLWDYYGNGGDFWGARGPEQQADPRKQA